MILEDDLDIVISAVIDDLVNDAVAGQQDAIKDVLRLIRPSVVTYCRHRIDGQKVADEVAQEVCLTVLKALPSYRDQAGSFLAFVDDITARIVAHAHRSAARDRAEPLMLDRKLAPVADRPMIEVQPHAKRLAPAVESTPSQALENDRDALVSAAVGGDPNAIEGVLRWIRPLMLRYCRLRLGSQERTFASADDVAQEVCLAVLSALPGYRDQGRPFLAFVYGIAARKVADVHRSASRNRAESFPDTTDQADGPEDQVMHGEFVGRMARLMESLSDRQRDILHLRIVVGLSVEETAEAVGSTPGAVRVAMHRALNRLRAVLVARPAVDDREFDHMLEAADLALRERLSAPTANPSDVYGIESTESDYVDQLLRVADTYLREKLNVGDVRNGGWTGYRFVADDDVELTRDVPVTHGPPGCSQPRHPGIDTARAHSARIWNYWLGGKDNYPVDREVGDQIFAVLPDIVDAAHAQRGFLVRAVRYLASEAGIRQFLDIGTGLPTADNTHEVAQETVPECRIVYVDNDPLILAHAGALLTSTSEGATDYVNADLRNPDTIVREAARTLNFTQPVALMLLGIVEHIVEIDEAQVIVSRLLDTLPSGSYLALCHLTSEVRPEVVREAERQWNKSVTPPIKARSRQELIRFFDGLELLEPGVVSASLWRPEASTIGALAEVFNFSGVGRKP